MNEEASMDQLFLDKVHEAIENNMADENFGVDELAHKIGTSRSQLHRRLKDLTGQSPSQMIKETRLKKAMGMLQNKVATASEISYQVGFSSPSYFNTCFNEYFGYPPGKVKRSRSFGITKKHSVSRKFIFISFATLVVVASVIILYIIVSKRNIATNGAGITYNSIAVLAFEDMSPGKDQEYFCDGIADQIINALTHVEGLKVIARTSAFSFKGRQEDIRDIGTKLGVETLLEGGVRKEGNRLRITVQLVKAEDGSHLWSEQYDRDVESIFDIQDEISLAIAENLKVKLLGEAKAAVVKRHTENLPAWEFYMRGNEYYNRGIEQHDLENAVKMYQKAIESDSSFALAYTRLAMSHLYFYFFNYDRSEDRLMKSKQAIDDAFRIEPELTEAYIALGLYYYFGFRDIPQALKQLEIAMDQSPQNPECILYTANAYRLSGNWEKATESFIRTFELDPRSSTLAWAIGQHYELLREYAKALCYYDIAIMLRPDYWVPYAGKARVYIKLDGNTNRARNIMREANQMVTSAVVQMNLKGGPMLRYELHDGNYEKALKYLQMQKSEAQQGLYNFRPLYHYYATIYGLMGNSELEYAYYDSSRLMLEDKLTGAPDDSRLYSSLGIAYAGLGRKKEAIEAGEKAVDLLPVSYDPVKGTFRIEELAQIYVMVGEYDKALEQLELLLSVPSYWAPNLLKIGYCWKPLHNNPKFIELLETYSEN